MKKIIEILPGYEDVVVDWLKEQKIKVKLYALGAVSFYFGSDDLTKETIKKLYELGYIGEEYQNIKELLSKQEKKMEEKNEF